MEKLATFLARLWRASFAIMPAADGGPMLFLISAPHIKGRRLRPVNAQAGKYVPQTQP
jgi:hypothetical protein